MSTASLAQTPTVPPFHERIITPERLGLPNGSRRNSEPVDRIWKTDENGNIKPIEQQPPGYPFTPEPGYQRQPDEISQPHMGVDVATPGEVNYKPGVYGVVTEVGVGKTNAIAIKLRDGTTLTYRHSSQIYVKPGDKVTPETVIARSGDKGAPGRFHVHIEAIDAQNKRMHPDKAFRIGEQNPNRPARSTQSNLGGVLVNPQARKDKRPLNPTESRKIRQRRPRSKSPNWSIKLPPSAHDEKTE